MVPATIIGRVLSSIIIYSDAAERQLTVRADIQIEPGGNLGSDIRIAADSRHRVARLLDGSN
jgi:hypothetical protein